MGTEVPPKVDAVTAGKYKNGKLLFLVIGGFKYARKITQLE